MDCLAGQNWLPAPFLVDTPASTYYLSGIYDRARFDKPLAHWPLWQAMLRSHQRGRTVFELGDVPLEGAASPKEVSIGYFKRGNRHPHRLVAGLDAIPAAETDADPLENAVNSSP